MCLIATLRSDFKQALTTGRVYRQHLNVYDPAPVAVTGDAPVDFLRYVRPVSDYELNTLQREERVHRRTLDTKLFQVKSTFAVTPGGVEKWGRPVSILISAFFKNGIFSATQRTSIWIPDVEIRRQNLKEVSHSWHTDHLDRKATVLHLRENTTSVAQLWDWHSSGKESL